MGIRKILLATTALCMGAGTAAAMDMNDGMAPPITLSGEAEMGAAGEKDESVRFHTDIDVTFTLSGETDGGVKFGSAIDIDEASDDGKGGDTDNATQNNDAHGGIAIFMEDADGFGKLTLGDAAGAIAWAVDDARGAGPGSLRDDHELGGDGNDALDGRHDGQILLWNRAIGSGFSMAASVELHDHSDGKISYDPIIGFGGKYSMPMGVGTLGLGAGFQMGSFNYGIEGEVRGEVRPDTDRDDIDDIWSGKVDATAFGGSVSMDFTNGGDGIKVIADAGLSEGDGTTTTGPGDARQTHVGDGERMHMGLGLGYTVGAISLGANVGTVSWERTYNPHGDDNTQMVETTRNGVGFSAAYDLGGGAALQFGVGSQETEYDWTIDGDEDLSGGGDDGYDHSTDTNRWSLGVKFKF